VQGRLPIRAGRNYAQRYHLVGTSDGQEHRLRPFFVRAARADNHLTIANAADQNDVSDGYTFLAGEALDDTRQLVAMLKAHNEHPANPAFTGLHIRLPG
jgi:hypothetical protein